MISTKLLEFHPNSCCQLKALSPVIIISRGNHNTTSNSRSCTYTHTEYVCANSSNTQKRHYDFLHP